MVLGKVRRAMPNQPVLVPGDMGTGSWLLEGVKQTEHSHPHVMAQEEFFLVHKPRNK